MTVVLTVISFAGTEQRHADAAAGRSRPAGAGRGGGCCRWMFGDGTRYAVLALSTLCLSLVVANAMTLNFTIICMHQGEGGGPVPPKRGGNSSATLTSNNGWTLFCCFLLYIKCQITTKKVYCTKMINSHY
jgi:hypothetical protein